MPQFGFLKPQGRKLSLDCPLVSPEIFLVLECYFCCKEIANQAMCFVFFLS